MFDTIEWQSPLCTSKQEYKESARNNLTMFGPNICSCKYSCTPKHLILLLVIITHVMYFEIIVIFMMATDYLQMYCACNNELHLETKM